MFVKLIFWLIFLFISSVAVHAQKKIDSIKTGIVNGRATYLPKPDYPQEAKDFCAGGKVEIEVLIGEKGAVLEAKAISGDELLRDASVEAVKKAKFLPTSEIAVKYQGIVVYNFDSLAKCIVVGVVNKRAKSLPKPKIPNLNKPKYLQIKEEQIVAVQIMIDMNGKVTRARALIGPPMLRSACENAALQTKFSPTLIDGVVPKIRALLVYKFKPDGTIDTNIEKDDKDVIGTPVNLIEPSPPFCNCRFGGNPSVLVEAKTDERGNVTEAKAWSGHPLLKNICEKAALESKFLPTDTKAKIMLIYHFESIGEGGRTVKFKSVEVKEVKF
jgi:Gram-negative bacterial TonB protein C-terminal